VDSLSHSALAGKRVVVTRAMAQAVELLKALQYAGSIPILLPVIRILPPESFSHLDETLQKLDEFDLVLFTSQNAVRIVQERLEALGLFGGQKIRRPVAGAVGDTTASEATGVGFEVVHVASKPLGTVLAEELGTRLYGKRVLLPRSDRANPDVTVVLEKLGARVTEIVAYRTVSESANDGDVVLKAMNADAVLFFSPSAVEGFDRVCGAGKLAEFATRGVVVASGPVTLAALHAAGITTAAAAKEPSVARIIEALANSFAMRDPRVSDRAN